jgi:uncharacterized membrane protein YphA (DoxX/SURF4 family)
MEKRNKIIYWIATLWMALGMLSTAIVQVFKLKVQNDHVANLGYPGYFLTLLGIWKILGVLALLIPKYPLLKEWAYAGFFFAMSGAIFSHVAAGDSAGELFPCVLLLILTAVSWYFRPRERKLILANQ